MGLALVGLRSRIFRLPLRRRCQPPYRRCRRHSIRCTTISIQRCLRHKRCRCRCLIDFITTHLLLAKMVWFTHHHHKGCIPCLQPVRYGRKPPEHAAPVVVAGFSYGYDASSSTIIGNGSGKKARRGNPVLFGAIASAQEVTLSPSPGPSMPVPVIVNGVTGGGGGVGD